MTRHDIFDPPRSLAEITNGWETIDARARAGRGIHRRTARQNSPRIVTERTRSISTHLDARDTYSTLDRITQCRNVTQVWHT